MKTKILFSLVACWSLVGCAATKNPLAEKLKADFGVASVGRFRHYTVPAMSDVQRLPDAYPADGIPGGPVRIIAARDEYEPASFLVIGTEKPTKVQLSVGELKNDAGDVFPAADLDLKVIKVWYQNRNGWFSYFGDTGFKLLPELLLNDEDLIRVDEKNQANYARLIDKNGKKSEYWLNPPRQMDKRLLREHWRSTETFHCMREDFRDAETLQPVEIRNDRFKQFFLTAHVRTGIPAGIYKGEIKLSIVQPSTSDLQPSSSIPVEIKVLDFTLPQPKCYTDPEKDFLVSSYSYICPMQIMEVNGYDFPLAMKQLEAVFRDQAAHNQMMHMVRGNLDTKSDITIKAMQSAGMRTDVLMGGLSTYNSSSGDAKIAADEFDRRYGHHNVYIGYGDEPGPDWLMKARPVYEAYQSAGFKFFLAGGDTVFNKNGYLLDWHNVAKDATDGSSTRLWNAMQSGNHVAWYAQQHVGCENPSLNRRQNGLACWLNGYTAHCNYAHHFGPYNDDRTTYKPMVFAYGQANGVIDTLQWEGFREGIDDIRYATLMTDLARAAKKSDDLHVRYLGGKAMQYLASIDISTYDQDTVRLEMIRFIESLRAALPNYVAPAAPKPEPVVSPAQANLERELKGLEKAKDIAAVFTKYHRQADGARYLMERGFALEAAKLFEYMPEERDAAYMSVFTNNVGNANGREDAFWALIEKHPDLIKDFNDVLFSRFKPTDTNGIRRAVNNLQDRLGKRREIIWKENYATFAALYEQIAAKAKLWKVPLAPEFTINAFRAYRCMGQSDRAIAVAKIGLANTNMTAAVKYQLEMCAALAKTRGRIADCRKQVEKWDECYGKDLPGKDKVAGIEELGRVMQSVGNENLVRALDEFRKALYKPTPKKRYVVKFSDTSVRGIDDWKTLAAEESVCDRRYGGSLDFLTTDVSSGDRGVDGKAKETLPDPVMKVAADARGIHFFFIAEDPKAADVAMGVANAGSFEAYIAPGDNEPYVCMLMNPAKGTVGFFNTTYSTFRTRAFSADERARKYRFESRVFGDRIVTYLMLGWENWPGKTPRDGSVWDFESMCWHRAGNSCWNGTESIHGRSTWGELEFSLSAKDRVAILKPLIASARAEYLKETSCRGGYEGCVAHWKDPEVGDPDFYHAEVEAYAKTLGEYCELVKGDMSDSTVNWLADHALMPWSDIRYEISRRRTRWLEKKNFK